MWFRGRGEKMNFPEAAAGFQWRQPGSQRTVPDRAIHVLSPGCLAKGGVGTEIQTESTPAAHVDGMGPQRWAEHSGATLVPETTSGHRCKPALGLP